MSTLYSLQLSRIDILQLLDALSLRAEKWEKLIACKANDDTEAPEDGSKIANHYRRIISSIEKQINRQGNI